jgi:hypothetical protein
MLARFWPTADIEGLPEPGEIRSAQMASFARLTPINSFVTIATALMAATILWSYAPRGWIVGWAGLQSLVSLIVLHRWWRYRDTPIKASISERGPRKAKLWALASGALWGSGVGFLPLVPPIQQMALIIVVGAMAAGATTTLAAVPVAAGLFISSAILPFAGYFVLQDDPVYLSLAILALIMAVAMLASTRLVHGAFLDDLRTRQKNVALLDELHAARQEWLEISDTADAFALFDESDQLLLWNENYRRVLSLPEDCLYRGRSARICSGRVQGLSPSPRGRPRWKHGLAISSAFTSILTIPASNSSRTADGSAAARDARRPDIR